MYRTFAMSTRSSANVRNTGGRFDWSRTIRAAAPDPRVHQVPASPKLRQIRSETGRPRTSPITNPSRRSVREWIARRIGESRPEADRRSPAAPPRAWILASAKDSEIAGLAARERACASAREVAPRWLPPVIPTPVLGNSTMGRRTGGVRAGTPRGGRDAFGGAEGARCWLEPPGRRLGEVDRGDPIAPRGAGADGGGPLRRICGEVGC